MKEVRMARLNNITGTLPAEATQEQALAVEAICMTPQPTHETTHSNRVTLEWSGDRGQVFQASYFVPVLVHNPR